MLNSVHENKNWRIILNVTASEMNTNITWYLLLEECCHCTYRVFHDFRA